jgi:hypothetical protein
MDMDGLPPASITGGFRVRSALPTAVIFIRHQRRVAALPGGAMS